MIRGLLWVAMAGMAAALLALMHTRWGRSRPVRKCLVLSALAHLWLAGFLLTVKIVRPAEHVGPPEVRVRLSDGIASQRKDSPGPHSAEKPRETPAPTWFLRPIQREIARAKSLAPPQPEGQSRKEPLAQTSPEARDAVQPTAPRQEEPKPQSTRTIVAKPGIEPAPKAIEGGKTQGRAGALAASDEGPRPGPPVTAEWATVDAAPDGRPASGVLPEAGSFQMPELYRLRTAPNRSEIAGQLGASAEAEAAVQAALRWLAENQEPDGRWSASRHGGGQETYEAGRDRQRAGSRADAGVTALAILSMAANGNTHLEGVYRSNVRAGIEFLLRLQGPDGNLAGGAELYELMYCHAMATLALGELAGMTGDPRLREPLQRAVGYVVAAQDPAGGGWRYRPREPGDTSQLGWQLMALRSAELAGIQVPEATWRGAARFLESVSGGNHGGLASYRPGERFSRPMTAEALACRQFLGQLPSSPACREAADHLLGELPGESDPGNLYYWYYATLALYPAQGPHWRAWSAAIQRTLLATQRRSGPLAGSWDLTTRWDRYGGRVYATALAALCLETYYRFMPGEVGSRW